MKDLSRLIIGQLSKRDHKHYTCDRCLHYFHSEQKLMAHEVDCSKMNECAVTSPSPGNEKLKFRKSTQIDNVRFVVYADFQSIIKESELNSENS